MTDRIVATINDDAGSLTLTINRQTAFVYRFGPAVDLPRFDPFSSPSERAMTVKIIDPYPHHRSFWVAEDGVQPKAAQRKRASICPLTKRERIDQQCHAYLLAVFPLHL